MRGLHRFAVVSLGLFLLASLADGQNRPIIPGLPNPFPPGPRPGPYPPGPSPYTPYNPYSSYVSANPGAGYNMGAYMQGQATVMQAQGDFMIQSEQARLAREQVNQEKLVTKKKTLDEVNYERENTWTWSEEQDRTNALLIRRLINSPMPTEITNATAMNTLLPYLNKIATTGSHGPPVPLNQELLRSINVTGGTGAASGANIGVIKDGKVAWPIALRGPAAQQIDGMLPQTVSKAIQGTLLPADIKKLNTAVDKLSKDASKAWNAEEIDTGMYLSAKHFIESLKKSFEVLQAPDAAKYFDQTYAARGATVDELARNMTQQGLKFAPATQGGESAYFSLYSAMTSYAAADGPIDTNFKLRLASQTTAIPK